ncbi:hypothetical protein ACYRFS_13020 [Listeria kieliensis]
MKEFNLVVSFVQGILIFGSLEFAYFIVKGLVVPAETEQLLSLVSIFGLCFYVWVITKLTSLKSKEI